MRATEVEAPPWLRWKPVHLPEESGQAKSRSVPQRHQAALLVHKGLLGEGTCLAQQLINSSALHRPWFFKAILDGGEPAFSPFSTSFIACISSARRHTEILRSVHSLCPEASSGWWFFVCTFALRGPADSKSTRIRLR